MRLFWKLFFSMVIITSLACSAGGYILIDQQFRASIDREAEALYEENDLLRYTLIRETENALGITEEELGDLVERMDIAIGEETASFRISDAYGKTIASMGSMPVDAVALITQLSENQRGWILCQGQNGREYLHAASPMTLEGNTIYLENCQDVSYLFQTRSEQYHMFFYLMLALIAAVGLLSLAVSSVILRPLARLSDATRRIATGELDKRVPVRGEDELGRLSADFNVMAERLEKQVQELTAAGRRQEDFIGSFAHEIKTPLTSIIGYADLLCSRPVSPAQVRDSARYIFNEGRRLEALSHKLMALIVLEKQDFSWKPVPVERFLRRIADGQRPVLAAEGIELRLSAADARIPLEPDLMETVCLNLIDNARKSIDGRGVVLLEGIAEGDGYCIRVTDTGKGIPAGELGRITEPFYMVDKSRARAQGGAGLGLALCQRIVALHGGVMEFRSREGKGTRVSVHLKGGAAE